MYGEYLTCPECGNTFYADQPWKRICYDCWKRGKQRSGEWRGGRSTADDAQTSMELSRLRSEVTRLQAALTAAVSVRQQPANIPAEQMRRLLHLCHPDKHGNSAASKEVTQWLLKMRAASKN